MKIRPKQLFDNTLPLFEAARASELRYPMSGAASDAASAWLAGFCLSGGA